MSHGRGLDVAFGGAARGCGLDVGMIVTQHLTELVEGIPPPVAVQRRQQAEVERAYQRVGVALP